MLGDGVWEGLRVSGGHPAFLEQHLDRLEEGARAIMLDLGHDREELTEAIYATLRANEMTDGVHVRLMVTRGVKSTPYQDPRVTVGPATVVIIAEHKEPLPATVTDGITLFTTHVRRATPDTLDPKLNAHSKLNDIQACIQAYTAGADEALMLDPQGFVATCNSTHFFIVTRAGEVWTSDGRFCLAGITRANVLEVCRAARDPRAGDDLQPDRRLQRLGGVRDRHLRRRRAGARRSTAAPSARGARAGRSWTGSRSSTSGTWRPTSAAGAPDDRPGGDVVGPAQHLHRDDARPGRTARTPWSSTSRSTRPTSPRTGLDHPGREEVIASQPTDLARGGRGSLRTDDSRRPCTTPST